MIIAIALLAVALIGVIGVAVANILDRFAD